MLLPSARVTLVYNPKLNHQGKFHVSLEEKIYELRQEKLKQIEALGQRAYPYRFEFTHTVPQILAEYGEKTAEELTGNRVDVKVAGRIVSIRLQGKAGFAHLQQDGKRLQIYVKLDFVGAELDETYLKEAIERTRTVTKGSMVKVALRERAGRAGKAG